MISIVFYLFLFKGTKLTVEEFMDRRTTIAWMKYKKKFIAIASNLNLTVEFRWTTRFEVDDHGLPLRTPVLNPSLQANDSEGASLNESDLLISSKGVEDNFSSRLYEDRALKFLDELSKDTDKKVPDLIILGTLVIIEYITGI